MDPIESKQAILSWVNHNIGLFLENMKTIWLKRNIPNISWNTAAWINNILEIGPANGFSTMILSMAASNAYITTVEFSRHAFEELRYNLSLFVDLASGESPQVIEPAFFWPRVTSSINRIDIGQFALYYADARELLPAFQKGSTEIICHNPFSILQNIPRRTFDCIYIDGAFRMTREFFDLSRPILSKEGIIIIDDAIKYRWKMEGFHEYLEKHHIYYELVQTDKDDGVMVIEFWNIYDPFA